MSKFPYVELARVASSPIKNRRENSKCSHVEKIFLTTKVYLMYTHALETFKKHLAARVDLGSGSCRDFVYVNVVAACALGPCLALRRDVRARVEPCSDGSSTTTTTFHYLRTQPHIGQYRTIISKKQLVLGGGYQLFN